MVCSSGVGGVIALLMFVPEWVQDEIFSPGGVLLIGTIVPVHETVVAVCSIDAADDRYVGRDFGYRLPSQSIPPRN